MFVLFLVLFSSSDSPVEPFNHPVTFVKEDGREFGPVVATLTQILQLCQCASLKV